MKYAQFVFGKMIIYNTITQNAHGGANSITLKQARENFKKCGAISDEYVQYVRKPLEEEKKSTLEN